MKPITDRQKEVVNVMRMKLSEKQALLYLEGQGYEISARTLRREKAKLNKMKLQRLHLIAAMGFEDQHLERIDTCELIGKLYWQNYHICKDPYKKVMILKEIKELQPYISSYYEATKEVVNPAGQNNTSLPETTVLQVE